MSLKKMKPKQKRQIFEMIAALAVLAGEEMSEEGFAIYNDTLFGYIKRYDLLEDFIKAGQQAGIKKHPQLRNFGTC